MRVLQNRSQAFALGSLTGWLVTRLPLAVLPAIRAYFNNRHVYRQLLDMPDYLLDDVGLTRRQINDSIRPQPWC